MESYKSHLRTPFSVHLFKYDRLFEIRLAQCQIWLLVMSLPQNFVLVQEIKFRKEKFYNYLSKTIRQNDDRLNKK